MKKIIISLILSVSLFRATADEGMWLPLLIGQQTYNDMVKRGLKLTKDQLYNINKPSIKDGIVLFNGGACTGEIVSSQGLLFTNHHCGYGAITDASSVEHNYLKDGFYAYTMADERKSTVTAAFLEKIEDVTNEVEAAVKGLSFADRIKKLPDVYQSITNKVADKENSITGRVYSMFKGNQYLLYVYKTYRDVRLVGAPPESVGKFGGDPDNWEWPRHTGDYSIFRVYASKDGKPTSEYKADNVPMKSKWFFPISLKGVKEGDFTMIWGYPGSTTRYETSYGIKLKNDINNPSLVELRDMRLRYKLEQMKKDPAVKLKLAENYSQVANYWKFFEGETKQLKKYRTYEARQKTEQAFANWAKGKPEYENVISDYEKNYTAWTPYAKQRQYVAEGVLGSALAAFASSLAQVENALVKQGTSEADVKRAMTAADASRIAFLESNDRPSDEKILAMSAMMFYQNVDKSQHPIGFYEDLKNKFGSLDDESTYRAWAKNVYNTSMITDDAKWKAFIEKPDANVLQSDPAFVYGSGFVKNYNTKYGAAFTAFNNRNNEIGRAYLKGLMEMNPVAAKKMYPDANSSMRVSFGNVKSYRPRDGVFYDYVTTSKGLMEKYLPGDYDFDLPAKEIELIKKRDFGQYIDKQRNDLVIAFISTDDITGGNSGSPVLDANGNLLGLAFDGNYEALNSQIAFDKDLNRCINVDIRYVLWCIDKLGGQANIIKELKIVR